MQPDPEYLASNTNQSSHRAQQGGYGVLPQGVIGSQLPSRAKVLYAALRRYARDKDVCWPSRASLAEDTQSSVRSVARGLSDLRRAGLISIKYTGRSSTYRLLHHPSLYRIQDRRLKVVEITAKSGDQGPTSEDNNGLSGRTEVAHQEGQKCPTEEEQGSNTWKENKEGGFMNFRTNPSGKGESSDAWLSALPVASKIYKRDIREALEIQDSEELRELILQAIKTTTSTSIADAVRRILRTQAPGLNNRQPNSGGGTQSAGWQPRENQQPDRPQKKSYSVRASEAQKAVLDRFIAKRKKG